MIFIDFHKAFDSLEWVFVFRYLETFRFGPDFIWFVNVLYKNTQSCVMVLQQNILICNVE